MLIIFIHEVPSVLNKLKKESISNSMIFMLKDRDQKLRSEEELQNKVDFHARLS